MLRKSNYKIETSDGSHTFYVNDISRAMEMMSDLAETLFFSNMPTNIHLSRWNGKAYIRFHVRKIISNPDYSKFYVHCKPPIHLSVQADLIPKN